MTKEEAVKYANSMLLECYNNDVNAVAQILIAQSEYNNTGDISLIRDLFEAYYTFVKEIYETLSPRTTDDFVDEFNLN